MYLMKKSNVYNVIFNKKTIDNIYIYKQLIKYIEHVTYPLKYIYKRNIKQVRLT